jgi:hypothetical protein
VDITWPRVFPGQRVIGPTERQDGNSIRCNAHATVILESAKTYYMERSVIWAARTKDKYTLSVAWLGSFVALRGNQDLRTRSARVFRDRGGGEGKARTRTRIPARHGSVAHDGCAVACGTGTHHRPIVRVRSGLLNVCERAGPRARTVDDVAEIDEPAHACAAREALELENLLAHAGRLCGGQRQSPRRGTELTRRRGEVRPRA